MQKQRKASLCRAGSLPGVAAGQEALVSIILVGLAIVTLLLGYKHSALLFLNLAIAFFTYVRTAEGTTRSSQSLKSRDSPRTDDLPDWEIVLVKAEVVRDEQFQGDHRLFIYSANTSIVNRAVLRPDDSLCMETLTLTPERALHETDPAILRSVTFEGRRCSSGH